MTPGNIACMGVGFMLGLGAWFSQTDVPHDHCGIYRVENKVKTAYVLKPPVLEQAKCEAFCPTPFVQPKVEEAKAEEPAAEEEPPRHRRHYRHMRRHRREW